MSVLIKRIQRAVDFIEDHLDDNFGLVDASSKAAYSHYHFLRTFHALTGLTVGSYIKRRRLTRAAEALLNDKKRIIEIAVESGFDSQAAFSRAFKSMFNEAPARFRSEGKMQHLHVQPPITEAYLKHLQIGAVTMKPRFLYKESFTVIGMGKDSPAGTNMGPLWDEFLIRKNEIKQVNGKEAYGVCYASNAKENSSNNFHYTAALPVNDDAPVPDGMEKIRIKAHEYAVFTHTGLVNTISKTIDYIWKTWLPQSGFEPAESPDFELYDARFKADDPNSAFDIYVPITRP